MNTNVVQRFGWKFICCWGGLAVLTSVGISKAIDTAGAQQERTASRAEDSSEEEVPTIAAARTTDSGLLLEPDLDLSWFTREKFAAEMATVGKDRIEKQWTSPVKKLPEPTDSNASGLTEAEVQQYMLLAKKMFLEGDAIPVSDVGLISTQEDVIRQPMLNHISAFENSAVRVYLLVQRTAADDGWGYFSIVQDMTLDTPLDYYAQVFEEDVHFEGTSCYKCHSSGPLAIHPAREDLVLDAKLAAALGRYIAEQPRSEFHFPKDSPKPETGKSLQLSFCTECHDKDGDRDVLFQVHSHPIRVLVDYGYMPPDRKLTTEQVAELKAWLEEK